MKPSPEILSLINQVAEVSSKLGKVPIPEAEVYVLPLLKSVVAAFEEEAKNLKN